VCVKEAGAAHQEMSPERDKHQRTQAARGPEAMGCASAKQAESCALKSGENADPSL
jgi:hypothetical protein